MCFHVFSNIMCFIFRPIWDDDHYYPPPPPPNHHHHQEYQVSLQRFCLYIRALGIVVISSHFSCCAILTVATHFMARLGISGLGCRMPCALLKPGVSQTFLQLGSDWGTFSNRWEEPCDTKC